MLQWLAAGILVLISLWNVWGFDRSMSDFPPREQEAVFLREGRYVRLRNALLEAKYDGTYLGFITKSVVENKPRTPRDDQAWAQGQYVMLPWILVRDGHAISGRNVADLEPLYVIGDFSDAYPAHLPEDLIKICEFENLILFRRTSTP
jgi:hypothetical protein